eukprot:CAMPEP_0176500804 /NCGR_PEP_ID=MMETSP0200_2-20121128/13792_1 /TAXON_ID=947934 /ORGANISM="Chaetoceros sp., Strain GSL56" /LENGTH=396 /DNA_ID=CAMNT_0017899587 /DNA_START=260 /DNA_END=1447 /DNA_ORIENTATION=-
MPITLFPLSDHEGIGERSMKIEGGQENETEMCHQNTISRTSLSFISDPMQVYIEDTDAYGVMYNSNYIRAFERAMFDFAQKLTAYSTASSQEKQVPLQLQVAGTNSLLFDPTHDFYVTKVTAQKFKSSPVLGSSFVIHAKQFIIDNLDARQQSGDQQVESWSVEMIKYNSDTCQDGVSLLVEGEPQQQQKQQQQQKKQVFNTAIVTIAARSNSNYARVPQPSYVSVSSSSSSSLLLTNNNDNNNSKNEKKNHDKNEKTVQRSDVFTIHRDEFDVHLPNGTIPIRTALNLFERQRSNWLGGPHVLKQMMKEYNLQWVVTSIDDLEIFTTCSNSRTTHQGQNGVLPGMKVEVRSSIQVKRRGMILEFHQDVILGQHVLASGVVTICAIDAQKGRPTRD